MTSTKEINRARRDSDNGVRVPCASDRRVGSSLPNAQPTSPVVSVRPLGGDRFDVYLGSRVAESVTHEQMLQIVASVSRQ